MCVGGGCVFVGVSVPEEGGLAQGYQCGCPEGHSVVRSGWGGTAQVCIPWDVEEWLSTGATPGAVVCSLYIGASADVGRMHPVVWVWLCVVAVGVTVAAGLVVRRSWV